MIRWLIKHILDFLFGRAEKLDYNAEWLRPGPIPHA